MGSTRAALLKLLVEAETHLGLTREQLSRLDHHIGRLSELMTRQVEFIDGHKSRGAPQLAELMATYMAHRHRINVALAGPKSRTHSGSRLLRRLWKRLHWFP
jgi:hypothetical protein